MKLRKTLDSLVQRDDFKHYDITVHLENGQVISVGDFFDPNIKVKRSLDFLRNILSTNLISQAILSSTVMKLITFCRTLLLLISQFATTLMYYLSRSKVSS